MNKDELKLLERTVYNLWMAVLGNHSERGKSMFERMRNPVVGDMVMELTTLNREKSGRDGIGKLLEVKAGGLITKEWLIETPSGKQVRWTNADFIAIPEFDWFGGCL